MRSGLLALVVAASLALGLALWQGWLEQARDRVAAAVLSEEARLALEVGCRGKQGRGARECQKMLRRLYLAGTLDPDKTLRSYCDSISNARWGGSRPPPPKLCVERYGGWTGS